VSFCHTDTRRSPGSRRARNGLFQQLLGALSRDSLWVEFPEAASQRKHSRDLSTLPKTPANAGLFGDGRDDISWNVQRFFNRIAADARESTFLKNSSRLGTNLIVSSADG
jgi:hypothetical protein